MLDDVPFLLSDDLSWQRDSLCAEPRYDPDLWFSVGSRSTDRAKAVCRECLVMQECLVYALDGQIDLGVWGATTPPERADLLDAGLTAKAVAEYGPFAFHGLREEHEAEIDARVEAIRWGMAVEEGTA